MEPMHIWDYGRMSVGRHYVGKFDFDCSKNAGYAPLRKSYFAALELVNEFANRKKEIDADKNLTKEGKADAARKWLASRGTDLDAGRAAVERARSDLETRRTGLTIPKPDKDDVAAAVLRMEMRTMLRGMDPSERGNMLRSGDRFVAEAVLEAPDIMSGVTKLQRDALVADVIERHHPGQTEALAEYQNAIETTQRAIAACQAELGASIGVPLGRITEAA